MGLMTLTSDLLILKLVCESHQRWGNLLSEFRHGRFSGSPVIRYVRDGRTDGQTDGRTDTSNAYRPFPYWRGIIIKYCARGITEAD